MATASRERLAAVEAPRRAPLIPLAAAIRPDVVRLAPAGLVGMAAAFNLWVLRAETAAAMNLNDSAYHLAMIRWARYQIDQGRIPFDGWFPYLGMGFPLFHHYQSWPHIIAAYLSIVASPAVIFNWSLYLLLALWPISVYAGTRLLGWDRWTAGVAALVSPLLVSASWYGFEHSSFTWRGLGMWSALWGMWLLPIAWGLSYRAIKGDGSYVLAVLAVALTIAFHFLTGYLALLALGVWFLASPSLQRAGRTVLVGAGAVLAASPVIVPLMLDSRWSLNSEYLQGTFWRDSYGAPKVLGWLITGQLYDSGRFPVISLFVGLGLLVCLARFFKDDRARAIIGIWALSLALFFGRPTLGPVLGLLPGSDDVLFHRYIIGVHLAGIVMAAIGAVWITRQAVRMTTHFIPRVHRVVAIAAMAVLGILALTPAWQQVAGYDAPDNKLIPSQQVADETDGADVAALLDRVRILGGGRVYAGSANGWGPSYRVGSVPMYTVLLNQATDASGFTLRVPSLLSDAEVQFDERNPAQYDLFNLRYLILPDDRVSPVPATVLAIQGRHRLWQVSTSGYVDVVDTVGPAIVANRYSIGRQTASFLGSADLPRKQFPVLAFAGQAPAVPTLAPGVEAQGPAGSVEVESTRPQDGVFRADITANRIAFVLLKATYDPHWQVTVDGVAVQPEMVAPGMVGTTVAPGDHSLSFRYVPYQFYPLLILLTILTLVGLYLGSRRIHWAVPRGVLTFRATAARSLARARQSLPRMSPQHDWAFRRWPHPRELTIAANLRRIAPFAGYLLLQTIMIAGLPTARFPTSIEYLQLDFTGGGYRLWTVPLLYTVLPTDALRLTGQVVLAAICWWLLASVASSMVADRRVRIGIRIVLLALGLVSPIASWNSTILSESASLSLTALLVAAWLHYARHPKTTTALLALLATVAWTFTRSDHVVMGVFITVAALTSVLWSRRKALALWLASALVAVNAWGFIAVSRNDPTVPATLMATVVAERILPDASRTAWFVDHGMPLTLAIAAYSGVYPPEQLADDPDFGPWARAHGSRVYVEFMLTHPGYVLLGPLPYLSGEEASLNVRPPAGSWSPNPTPSLFSPTAQWARHRAVLPRVIEDLLFEQGQIGDLLLLAGGAFALAFVAWRRHGWDRRLLLPMLIVASVIPHAYLVWLGSATEIDRHALIVAISARIALWITAALALDRILVQTSVDGDGAARRLRFPRRQPLPLRLGEPT